MDAHDAAPAAFRYADFEVAIGPRREGAYPLTVRSSVGTRHATLRLPWDDRELERRCNELEKALLGLRAQETSRRALSSDHQIVEDFGRALFGSLFADDVRGIYDRSLDDAEHDGKGLRLKLCVEQGAPELAALPWEFLFDPDRRRYVGLYTQTPVVRDLNLRQAMRPLPPVSPPLRILGMMASPRGLARLDIEREKRQVGAALEDLQRRGLVEVHWLPRQTWKELRNELDKGERLKQPWHVFHFVGHGDFNVIDDEGMIALADEDGNVQTLKASALGVLLAQYRDLRLVLLNACEGARGGEHDVFSSSAAILVQEGIPAVVGMQYNIPDRAASVFAQGFYEALAKGKPVDTAVTDGRLCLMMEFPSRVEWGVPVLYMRTPDGVLFNFPLESAPNESPVPSVPELEAQLSDAVTRRDWTQAVELGERILVQDGTRRSVRATTARSYRARAAEQAELGALGRAVDDLTRALDHDPRAATALGLRAAVLMAQGDLDLAVDDLNEALRLDPQRDWCYALRAQLRLSRGEPADAIADLDQTIDGDTREGRYFLLRGLCRYHLGHYADVVADLSRGIDRLAATWPGVAGYRRLCGLAHGALGNHQAAIAELTETIAGGHVDAVSHGYRGISYVSLGEYDRARADLRTASELAGEGEAGDWSQMLRSLPKQTRFARFSMRFARAAVQYEPPPVPVDLVTPFDLAWIIAQGRGPGRALAGSAVGAGGRWPAGEPEGDLA